MLIIGGSGFIGTSIAKYYLGKYDLTILDKEQMEQFLFNEKINFINHDMCNQVFEDVEKNFSYIINCASILGIETVMKNPNTTLNSNVLMAKNALKIVESQESLKKYIYLSTSEVYGENSENAIESQSLNIGLPHEERWSYAISKLFAEFQLLQNAISSNLNVNIIRPFNIYGVGRGSEGAINKIVTDMMTTGKVTISSGGTQKRAWCEITDFLDGLNRVLRFGKSKEIYNIGNPNEIYSINEVLEFVKKNVKKNFRIIETELNQDITIRYPNIKKIEKLGYKPKVSLGEGIKKIITGLEV